MSDVSVEVIAERVTNLETNLTSQLKDLKKSFDRHSISTEMRSNTLEAGLSNTNKRVQEHEGKFKYVLNEIKEFITIPQCETNRSKEKNKGFTWLGQEFWNVIKGILLLIFGALIGYYSTGGV